MEPLTEDDIPGASLDGRTANQLTNDELRFWLKCRGIKSISKLTTKAALIAEVDKILDPSITPVQPAIRDPTAEQLYIKRKRQKLSKTTSIDKPAGIDSDAEDSESKGLTTPQIPLDEKVFGKSLENLPDFSYVNIDNYLRMSGKYVSRTQSITKNEVCKQTCTRPDKRGYAFFAEGYLHDILVFNDSHQNKFFCKAKCFASQKKNATPHSLWCSIQTLFPYNVDKGHCTCIAGTSGFCNHIFALLYQISHYSMTNIKEIPLDISKTSRPQTWDKPRIHGIVSEPVMDIEVRKARNDSKSSIKSTLYEARVPSLLTNNATDLCGLQGTLKDINPLFGITYMASHDNENTEYVQTSLDFYTPRGSVLSYQLALTEGDFSVSCETKYLTKFLCTDGCKDMSYPMLPMGQYQEFDINMFDVTTDTKSFIKNILVTSEQSMNIEKETRAQANSEKWWQERKYRLTASKFADILCRKTKVTDKFVNNLISINKIIASESLKHGRKYEDIAANKYVKYMHNIGRKVQISEAGFVVRPDLPFLGCSPDRKVLDPSVHPHFGLLEVKCPYKYKEITPTQAAKQDSKFCCQIIGDELVLRHGHPYHYQIFGQMAICGASWCDFVVYTFKGMNIQRIAFDSTLWIDMQNKLQRFYFEHFIPVAKFKLGN